MAELEFSALRVFVILALGFILFIAVKFYRRSKRSESRSRGASSEDGEEGEKKIEKEQKKERRWNKRSLKLTRRMLRQLSDEKEDIITEDREERVQFILANKLLDSEHSRIKLLDIGYEYKKRQGDRGAAGGAAGIFADNADRGRILDDQISRRLSFLIGSLERENKHLEHEMRLFRKEHREEQKKLRLTRRERRGEKKDRAIGKSAGNTKGIAGMQREVKTSRREKIVEENVLEFQKNQIEGLKKQKEHIKSCIEKANGVRRIDKESEGVFRLLEDPNWASASPINEFSRAYFTARERSSAKIPLFKELANIIKEKNQLLRGRYAIVDSEQNLEHKEGILERFKGRLIKGVIKKGDMKGKK